MRLYFIKYNNTQWTPVTTGWGRFVLRWINADPSHCDGWSVCVIEP